MVGGPHQLYTRRATRAKLWIPHDVGGELRALRGAKADAAKRLAHVEPSATRVRVRVLSAWSPSRSSRLTSCDGQRFEERQPPQNPVDRTIVEVSTLEVRLAYPDTSPAVRPARDRQIEPEAAMRARTREIALLGCARR
jgi:hypothetical protein